MDSKKPLRSEEIMLSDWLNDHCDMEGSHLGQNGGPASNPSAPARSPGLAPHALTRPPTGPITRGKTNKGSYYTLLMKGTRGEGGGGEAGHHRNKRALTDPHLHHQSSLTTNQPPASKPATSTARMPPRCVTPGARRRSGEVGGFHGLLIE